MLKMLFAAVMLTATQALADPVTMSAPVYGQVVVWKAPDNFVVGFQFDREGMYSLELIPKGESVEAWTQMITLTGISGDFASVTVEQMSDYVHSGYQGSCTEKLSASTAEMPAVPGATDQLVIFLSCPAVAGTDHSESVVMMLLAGPKNTYTLQWAARGPAGRAEIPFDAAWEDRLNSLATSARLCDPEAGEAPPYPSCLN